jgi:hypothetical protein
MRPRWAPQTGEGVSRLTLGFARVLRARRRFLAQPSRDQLTRRGRFADPVVLGAALELGVQLVAHADRNFARAAAFRNHNAAKTTLLAARRIEGKAVEIATNYRVRKFASKAAELSRREIHREMR